MALASKDQVEAVVKALVEIAEDEANVSPDTRVEAAKSVIRAAESMVVLDGLDVLA